MQGNTGGESVGATACNAPPYGDRYFIRFRRAPRALKVSFANYLYELENLKLDQLQYRTSSIIIIKSLPTMQMRL